MFKSNSTSKMREQLDRLAIPMFIAELRADDSQFEILALNATHETHSGMVMADVIHRPLSDILPAEEAREVNTRYSRCIQHDGPVRYREQLRMPHGAMIWDTSLSHLSLPDGRERVIGTAVIVKRIKRHDLDTLAFHDVEYFAASSSMRLNQISDVLEAVESGHISPEQLAGSAGMLAALCRSIDETMRELRRIATDRLAQEDQMLPLIASKDSAFSDAGCEVDSAINALIAAANNLNTGVGYVQPTPTEPLSNDTVPQHRQ
ncbi:hypothetical protein [Sulfitobacter sp.]|uniref:hypothetical protein n=1 Tax=Sulfitobacter sp. TaxID=1903071 RepID=UPI0030014E42